MKMKNVLDKMILLIVAFLLITSLTGCSQTTAKEQQSEYRHIPDEPIYNVEIKGKSIWYTVKSNGCTDTSKFRLAFENKGDVAFVTLIRIKPDYCKARSRLVVIDMKMPVPLSENAKVVIRNPFVKKFNRQLKDNKKHTKL